MERGILREITPLQEHDFMYVADRRKKEFDYPVHYHDIMELNFVENAKGSRRIVGDSSEVIGDYDLVLITSSDLEHVWEQYECKSEDAKSLGIPNNDIRLLDKAILLWETTEDVAKGRRLLERYTLLRYDNPKQYRAWFLKYKDKLFFTESGGWKWLVNTQDKNVPGNDYGVLHYNEVPEQKTPEISGDTNRDNPVLISGVVNNLPDGDKELVIRVKMHNGFHIYGFVSDQDPYIATTFDIQTEGDWKKVGELQIPSFKNLGSTGTTIYEGDVMFRQRLKGSGTGKVTCMVNYQTCDEHACLPPTDVELIFDLR